MRLNDNIDKINSEELVYLLKKLKLTLSIAESCTGGLVMKKVTDISGASAVFKRGFVTYSDESKIDILAVNPHTLTINGAVSKETISEMLDGLLAITKADIVCAVSGIAGPDGGTDSKPVGTVFSGFSRREDNIHSVVKYNFTGNREEIREKSAKTLIDNVVKYLRENLEQKK